jgi:hypothetical protein
MPIDRIFHSANGDRSFPIRACFWGEAGREFRPFKYVVRSSKIDSHRRSCRTYTRTAPQASHNKLSEAWDRQENAVRISCKRMEPVNHVPFNELLRGVQQ